MKRKSIFITGLMVLMALLVFVGCEQASINLPKHVASADIKQNGVFLEGQPFDASKFSVTVIYTDGTKEELTGVNVYNEDEIANNGDALKAAAGTNAQGGVFYAEGSLVAYAIDSLTVTGPTATITTSKTAKDDVVTVKDSDFTVAANYRDSAGTTQTLTLVPGADYTVEAKLDQALSAAEPAGTARAAVTLTFGTDKTPTGNQVTGLKVSYVPSSTPEYDGFDWYQENLVYRVVPASNNVKYIQRGIFDGESMIELYKVYTAEDEVVSTLTDGEYYLEKVDPSDVVYTLASAYATDVEGDADDVQRFGEAATATISAFGYTYIKDSDSAYGFKTVADAVVGSVDDLITDADGHIFAGKFTAGTSIQISDIKADYVAGLEAEAIGTNPYLVGWVAQDSFFKVTATYASGIEDDLTATTDFVVDKTPVKAGQTLIEIKLTGDILETAEDYTGSVTATTASIKVQAADYPSSIKASWKDGQPSTAGTAINKESFTFDIEWASGNEYDGAEEKAPDVTYSISPSESVVGNNVVKITWSCNGVTGSCEDLTFSISG